MSQWLCILTPRNYEIVKEKLIWGVDNRHKKILQKVRKKDKLVMYLLGEKKIRGIYEVRSSLYEDESRIFPDGFYPYRVKLKKIKEGELNIIEILDKLELFRNVRKNWGLKLIGRAMIQLTKEDYEIIEKNI